MEQEIGGNVFKSPLTVDMSKNFEMEKLNRAIDQLDNVGDLRKVAKDLVSLYLSEKAVTRWLIDQAN
jgi:hypothetical protein